MAFVASLKSLETGCNKFLSALLLNISQSFQLPNMDFPINGKAEGRILLPWEHKQYPNLTIQDTSGTTFACLVNI